MTAPTLSVDLADRVRQALVDLGEWPNDVARNLLKAGAYGRRYSGCFCPVARYLVALPDLGIVVAEVDPKGYVRVTTDQSYAEVVTPVAVAMFARGFDQGAYPDLIGRETPSCRACCVDAAAVTS
jgi:hypothetical protein